MRVRLFFAVAFGFLVFAATTSCQRNIDKHLTLAKDALFRRDPHAALLEYRKLLDLLERDGSTSSSELRAMALLGAAQVYQWELGEPQHAISVYHELISQCPDSPQALEARIALAELLRRAGDVRGAIALLSAAVAKGAPQADALNHQIAKWYFQLGDYAQSAVEAQKVHGADALLLRGQALAMQGDRAGALSAWAELTAAFPDSELTPHALFEMRKLQAEAGNDERAIELWVKSLPRHPEPKLVQSHIARARSRIAATTPLRIGEAWAAFDHGKARPRRPLLTARTSVEAAGGSAAEAARDFGD